MSSKTKFPLYSPGQECETNKNITVLVADLRVKYAWLSLYDCKNGEMLQKQEKQYVITDYASFSELVKQYLADEKILGVTRISIAVPGPVHKGKCITPNLPWVLEADVVKKELGFERVYLINDLEATAYSLADIEDSCFNAIHVSPNKVRGNVAILAPGNGLGEAGLYYDGTYLRPFATEGGHTEFSPRNDFEIEFYQFLTKIYGIVTWENVLSKEGFYNIYRFLRDVGRHTEDPWLSEKVQNGEFVDVVVEAIAEKKTRLLKTTIDMYLEFLAREANNLTLKLKATGGLIITGEIPDKIFDLINKDKFYKNFKISDRMEHLLKDIPIYIVRNPKGISNGAAHYGAFIEE